ARVVRQRPDVEVGGALRHRDPARLAQRTELHRRSRPATRSAAVYAGSAIPYARYSSGDGTVSCAPTQRRTEPPKPRLNRYGPYIGSSFGSTSVGMQPRSKRFAPSRFAPMLHSHRSAYAACLFRPASFVAPA